MIPELGHFALIVALLLALTLGALGLAGAQRARPDWMALTRPLALGLALCVALAWLCLVQAFVANDFSLRNVAENSTTLLPLPYRVAAAWGSHEGSMLLWLLMQSLWLLALRRGTRALPASVAARVLGVMGLVAAGLLLFVLFSSNPFLRLFPIPAEGRDLNPLLQDPGMVLHPPLLYLGYTGFSIPFAFALTALLDRSAAEGAAWARWSRRWTAAAWAGLTLGVAVGSWWAYTELGWGGWWFWDPVENAAFMPWLLGTALLHALAVAARRQLFQPWTALLAIATFALSLLGTFLVRSGVLSSVHAFAIDPRRGIFILALLLAVAGGSLALFARRGAALGGGGAFDPVSRETALLAGTLLLAVACGTVMLGTFYPLVMEVLGLARVSVGAPYFEAVFVPLMLPLLLLAGLGPALRWQRGAAAWRRLLPALGLALAVGATAAGLAGASWRVALGLALAAWLPLAAATTGRRPGLAGWALWLAHGGLALFVTGVALVRGLETERDLRLAPGERAAVGAFELRFDGVTPVPGPNYEAERGRFELLPAGPTLWPEKRRYTSMAAGNGTTEAAIASSLAGDIYIALGQPDGDAGAWTLRVYHKPFVGWIWAGCGLMVLGGAVAAVARRRQG